jgi:hypothetical protein
MSCENTVQRICTCFLWWCWNCHDQKRRCCSGVVDKWWFVIGIGFVVIRVRNSTTTETWTQFAVGFIIAHEQGFGTVCRDI